MSKSLTLDEMLEVALKEDLPSAVGFQAAFEALGSRLADELGAYFSIDVSPATFDIGEGLFAAFRPMFPGQEVPTSMIEFDPNSDWNIEPMVCGKTQPIQMESNREDSSITLIFSKEVEAHLCELQTKCQVDSIEEVFGNALQMYAWLMKTAGQNAQVTFTPKTVGQ